MQTSHKQESQAEVTGKSGGQAWLSSAPWDFSWILAPALISSGVVLIFREQISENQNIPLWVWVCFILLIDVAHVYATLFRTYLDPLAFQKNKTILLAMPAVAWIGGSLLYSLNELYFWRALAYLAVFHFVRQQFGFMVLYARKEPPAFNRFRFLDCAAIYAATLYPLLYWHTHPRNFSWFVAGDFFSAAPGLINEIGLTLYAAAFLLYAIKEMVMARAGYFNIPKNLLLLGTALSWWIGIIAVNSDMAFTITNVVSHGLPYMALIWLYHGKKTGPSQSTPGQVPKFLLSGWQKLLISNVVVFFLFLALLAYVEEGFWDGLIWREHLAVFAPFSQLPHSLDGALLALLIPFLALPQSTHYLLDGFIWRVRERNNIWSA